MPASKSLKTRKENSPPSIAAVPGKSALYPVKTNSPAERVVCAEALLASDKHNEKKTMHNPARKLKFENNTSIIRDGALTRRNKSRILLK